MSTIAVMSWGRATWKCTVSRSVCSLRFEYPDPVEILQKASLQSCDRLLKLSYPTSHWPSQLTNRSSSDFGFGWASSSWGSTGARITCAVVDLPDPWWPERNPHEVRLLGAQRREHVADDQRPEVVVLLTVETEQDAQVAERVARTLDGQRQRLHALGAPHRERARLDHLPPLGRRPRRRCNRRGTGRSRAARRRRRRAALALARRGPECAIASIWSIASATACLPGAMGALRPPSSVIWFRWPYCASR